MNKKDRIYNRVFNLNCYADEIYNYKYFKCLLRKQESDIKGKSVVIEENIHKVTALHINSPTIDGSVEILATELNQGRGNVNFLFNMNTNCLVRYIDSDTGSIIQCLSGILRKNDIKHEDEEIIWR